MTTKTSRATFRSSLRAFLRFVQYRRIPSPLDSPPCHLDLSLKSSSPALSRFLLPLPPVRVARDEHHLRDALYFDRAMTFCAASNSKKCEGTSRESLSITEISKCHVSCTKKEEFCTTTICMTARLFLALSVGYSICIECILV